MSGDHGEAERRDGRQDVEELLAAVVDAVGGAPRPGQQAMARAVAEALSSGEHLLVQAGTGTGKSLAYLVPVVEHAVSSGRPVIVSTATLALQEQVVERDLPRLGDALAGRLGRRPTWQLVKGRRNYVCLEKVGGGFPDEDDALFDLGGVAGGGGSGDSAGATRLGREVVRLRSWAERTGTGDRSELVPGVGERAWRQVSVSAQECLGRSRCPSAQDCFCEVARDNARSVDVVVTNHAFVAIDAFEGRAMLPEHDVLVIDEAHELVDRVTAVISDELTPGLVESAGRRTRRAGVGATDRLDKAAVRLGEVLEGIPDGRLPAGLPEEAALVVAELRDAARELLSELKSDPSGPPDTGRQVARAAVSEVHEVAERLAGGAGETESLDVVWVARRRRPDGTERAGLHVAPLTVAGLVRERVFGGRTVVLTSATLTLGGSFDTAAGGLGLLGEDAPSWRSLDSGSPFDYGRQGILYVARHLPPPGRDGVAEETMDELAALVEAAGGRTLGLFSSRRAAEVATEAMRARLDVPVLCQGDDLTSTLVREFARDAATCLFGTLSLWQGVDVPGSACQLVVIDRIPFPRPDDPLSSARSMWVSRSGGNGFMAVAASHAALLLAQGAGRLIRTMEDRGVVAVLDSRLATARYASYLRASLPPLWATTERDTVVEALRRIHAQAPAPREVVDPPRLETTGGT